MLGALALNLACAISAQTQTFTFNYTLNGFASGSYVNTVNVNTAAGKTLGLQCDDSSSPQGSKCVVSANAATLNVGSFKVIEPAPPMIRASCLPVNSLGLGSSGSKQRNE